MTSPYDNKQPPENEASRKALDMTRNDPALVKHAKEKVIKIGKEFKCEEELQPVMKAINDTLAMAEYVQNIVQPLYTKCWAGDLSPAEREKLKPGYFNFQDVLARQKLQEIDKSVVAERMKNVVMIYDINDKSEFVRAYISNNIQLDPNNPEDKKIIDLYDQCFHSWLVRNNMSSQDGVIFSTVKLDKKGNYVERANPQNVASIISDPELGLDVAVKKQGIGLALNVQRFNQAPEQQAGVRAETSS